MIGPNNGTVAGGVAARRMADRTPRAKSGGRRNSRCPGGALERRAALPPPSRGARPAGSAGHRGAPTPWARARIGPAGAGLRPPPESFSEIVLASAGEFPYSTSSHGGVAQLGERLTGSQEVRGSIPLVSTRALNEAPTQVGAFFHINRPAIYLCLAAVEVNPSQIATMNEINALRLCKPK